MEADDLRSVEATPDADSERLIADRLDALEAEKVLQRALELEAAAHDESTEAHTISTEQLEKIAKEIGVDSAFVQQALGEVRLQQPERGRLERFILPDDLVEMATIEGMTRSDADAAINKWMGTYEGLMAGTKLADGSEWDLDRRWMSRVVSSSLSGGNRISRVAGSDVRHRVHSSSETEHVVALESDGDWPLAMAKAAMVLAALIFVTGAIGSIGLGLVPFLQSVAGFAILGGAVAAGGVVAARRWARGIKAALRRSVNGMAAIARPRADSRVKRPWNPFRRKSD